MNSRRKPNLKFKIIILLSFTGLLFSALACAIDLKRDATQPDETEIARSVDQTLAAEQLGDQTTPESSITATIAPVESQDLSIQETIQAQQTTISAQATNLAAPADTPPAPQETAASTASPAAELESISLTEMTAKGLRQAPGCGQDKNGPPCWFGRGEELVINSRKPILIDPGWPSPYLVFSHRYDFVQNATIYIKAEGGWEVLWSFPYGRAAAWVPFQVDLSKYKGKEVMFQFIVSGTGGYLSQSMDYNEWYIRDPAIVPDHNPYK